MRNLLVSYLFMKKSIQLTVTYDFPVEEVWNALTDKQALSEWLMPCDMEPIVGKQFQFKTKPAPGFNGIIDCEVLEVVPNERLVFSWTGGSLKNTRVTFNLKRKGTQTILDFEHGGFEGFLNKMIVRRILSNGWKTKILVEYLPNYLAKR